MVRRMTYRDIADVMRIDAGQWCSALVRQDLDAYARDLDNLRGVVVETKQGIAGFALLSYPRRELSIDGLLVAVACRRKGIGTELMRYILIEASRRNKRQVVTTVHESNLAAQLFFSKSGLDCSCVLKKGSRHLDTYLMWKNLA